MSRTRSGRLDVFDLTGLPDSEDEENPPPRKRPTRNEGGPEASFQTQALFARPGAGSEEGNCLESNKKRPDPSSLPRTNVSLLQNRQYTNSIRTMGNDARVRAPPTDLGGIVKQENTERNTCTTVANGVVTPETIATAETDGASSNSDDDDDGIEIVRESNPGSNPLLDFPHRREDCRRFPFAANPARFCLRCYCYVCDVPAATCSHWNQHCVATHADSKSKLRRKSVQMRKHTLRPRKGIRAPSKDPEHFSLAHEARGIVTTASASASTTLPQALPVTPRVNTPPAPAPRPMAPALPLLHDLFLPGSKRAPALPPPATAKGKQSRKRNESGLATKARNIGKPSFQHWRYRTKNTKKNKPSRRELFEAAISAVTKRKPRRCMRCVENGAPEHQAMQCQGAKGSYGREACEYFGADPKVRQQKTPPPAAKSMPTTPAKRKPRRCMRCVEFGASDHEAVQCPGAKGKFGREACEYFDARGARLRPRAVVPKPTLAKAPPSHTKPSRRGKTSAANVASPALLPEPDVPPVAAPIKRPGRSSHYTRSSLSDKPPEGFGSLGAYWRGEPTKYAGVPYQKIRTNRQKATVYMPPIHQTQSLPTNPPPPSTAPVKKPKATPDWYTLPKLRSRSKPSVAPTKPSLRLKLPISNHQQGTVHRKSAGTNASSLMSETPRTHVSISARKRKASLIAKSPAGTNAAKTPKITIRGKNLFRASNNAAVLGTSKNSKRARMTKTSFLSSSGNHIATLEATNTTRMSATGRTTGSHRPSRSQMLAILERFQSPDAPATLTGNILYNSSSHRHSIVGTWHCPHSKSFPPQKFFLLRNPGGRTETVQKQYMSGIFDGYFVVKSQSLDANGNPSYKDRLVFENSVKLEFKSPWVGQNPSDCGFLKVRGSGSNKFGSFVIDGKAVKATARNKKNALYSITLSKRYLSTPLTECTADVENRQSVPKGIPTVLQRASMPTATSTKPLPGENTNLSGSQNRRIRLSLRPKERETKADAKPPPRVARHRATRSNSAHGIGTIVRKRFGNEKYGEGEVVHYDPIRRIYKIKYLDGSHEDFDEFDMKRFYKHFQRYSYSTKVHKANFVLS